MTRLLISVRNAEEAQVALRGGADLIDVKEPALGSLGRASAAIWTQVAHSVHGQKPSSAAMGELAADDDVLPPNGFRYLKWGLRGCADISDWTKRLADRQRTLESRCPE